MMYIYIYTHLHYNSQLDILLGFQIAFLASWSCNQRQWDIFMGQFHTLLLESSWEYNETRMGFTLWSQTWRAAKSQSSVLFAGKIIKLSGHGRPNA